MEWGLHSSQAKTYIFSKWKSAFGGLEAQPVNFGAKDPRKIALLQRRGRQEYVVMSKT